MFGPAEQDGTPASLPLVFIRNAGQFRDDILFMVISDVGPVSFSTDGSAFRVISPENGQSALLTYRFEGASGAAAVEGVDRLDCEANFLSGADPSAWITGVETYRALRYVDLYPGIDLLYEGVPDGLKSTYIVRPGADPGAINIEYSGQDELSIGPDGTLLLVTPAGSITHSAPYCYQVIDGSIVEVRSAYTVCGQHVGFAIGSYDPDYDLVIDPVMKYGLYLKGTGMADAFGVALDSKRNAYVTGRSFPTPYDVPADSSGNNAGGTDVVVVKINPDGTAPVYITYLGGNGDETGYGIRVDGDGSAYIAGTTNSTDFPVANPLQAALAGQTDAFIARLAPNGTSLIYSTYIGGTGQDYGYAIDIDTAGNAYITGSTDSKIFPVTSVLHHTTLAGINDAYIVKVSADGEDLVYSEYIGGIIMDTGYGIAVDESGSAYITGETYSWNFPVLNAYQPAFGGYSDVFITKVAPAGYPFVYSTYLGGSDMDGGRAIDVDAAGYAYVTGLTRSRNFPTADAFKPVQPGLISSFYSRLAPSGSALAYSTYLTGPGFDEGRGIAVTPSGYVYITGITKAPNLQLYDPFQPVFGGGVSDAFVAKFVNGEVFPAYLTYLGGDGKDEGHALTVDGICGVYVAGLTKSTNFPSSDPYPDTFIPKGDGGFIVLFWDEEICCTPPVAGFSADPDSGYAPLDVQFTDLSSGEPDSWFWEFGDGATSTEQNPAHTYTGVGNYTVNLTVENLCGTDETSGVIIVICREPVAGFVADPDSGYAPLDVQFTDTSQNNVTSWSWEFGDGATSTEQNPAH
ncbi:MAG: PKD domain-containing protein, partial [Methanomicrobiales archaeon]|nr:PKD domain-containing protein [Methanomicrobiales archaeon]